MQLKGKVAIVTGGTGGLGAGVTGMFSAAGAVVIVAERHLVDAGPGITVVETDVLDEASVQALVNGVIKQHGRIDILVNLVGGFAMNPVEKTPAEELEKMLSLNVKSTFLCCKWVLPHMKRQRHGRIINVGSRPAVRPETGAGMAAYAAAKAAVDAFTQALAAEVLQDNITVNAVLPSTIDTPANRATMPKADPSKWVQPESLAGVIGFLCSDAARDISGALVPVYGKS